MQRVSRILALFLIIIMLISSSMPTVQAAVNGIGSKADEWDGSTEIPTYDEDTKTFTIANAKQLAWVSQRVAGGNTFSGQIIELSGDISIGSKNWTPIGKSLKTCFSGIFNGNNFSISNVNSSVSIDAANILNAPYHAVGLFGSCINATICNLRLDNINLSIQSTSGYANSYSSLDGTNIYAGAVCGYANSTAFTNVVVSNISVTSYSDSEAGSSFGGGICGYAKDMSAFWACAVKGGTVSGKSNSIVGAAQAGGIVGSVEGECVISQSYCEAKVIGGHVTGTASTGGIVGRMESNADLVPSVIDCYNAGDVQHIGSWLDTGGIGGIAGYSDGTITHSYNSGKVVASTNTVGGQLIAAGICATGASTLVVSECCVMATAISGGTSNYLISSVGTKENNHALNSVEGSPVNDATALHNITEFYSTSIYSSTMQWDFSVWIAHLDTYPTLQDGSMVGGDAKDVIRAAQLLTIDFYEGDDYDRVRHDIGLSVAVDDVSVSWTSSNDSIINALSGAVKRQTDDCLVEVKAELTKGESTRYKIFVLRVLGEGSVPEETRNWGMLPDCARDLLAMVNDCKPKDISNDDPDFLVLTGANTNEADVIETVSRIMEYWEVPQENAYVRSQLGDILGTIKTGSEKAISQFTLDLTGGLVDYDSSNDGVVIKPEAVASKMLKIPAAIYNVNIDIVSGIKRVKSVSEISFNSEDDLVEQALVNAGKLEKLYSYAFETYGDGHGLGKIFGTITNGYKLWQLLKGVEAAKHNAVQAYFQTYLKNRGNYSSPDDEEFQMWMEVHALSSIRIELDNINQIAECLYILQDKFCRPVDEECRIRIMCPVDIEIYDSNGNIVGRVVDNTVDTSILNSLQITVEGVGNDEKTVCIPNGDEYTFRLIGNDVGTMSVEIINSFGDEVYEYHYDNIDLVDGKEMILETSASGISEGTAPQIKNVENGVITETVESTDNTAHKYFIIVHEISSMLNGDTIMSDIGGTVADGYVSADEDIYSLISANPGFSFDALYSDANCTVPISQTMMLDAGSIVYARFVENDERILITEQPQSCEYPVSVEASKLQVSATAPEGFSLTYQWYLRNIDADTIVDTPISGAVESGYTPQTAEEGIYMYYAVITAKNSEEETIVVRSDVATIYVFSQTIQASGQCGQNLTWTLTDTNDLYISGYGDMTTWSSVDEVPWKDYIKRIERIHLGTDVTSVSSYAFAQAEQLTALSIPKSVLSIGERALYGCKSLLQLEIPFVGKNRTANEADDAVLGHIFGKALTSDTDIVPQYYKLVNSSFTGKYYCIPRSLETVTVTDAEIIPFGAFSGCDFIKQVNVGTTVTSIKDYAFRDCTGIKDFLVPNSVISIGSGALYGCTGLENLSIPFIGSSRSAGGESDGVLGHIFGYGSAETGTLQCFARNGSSLSGVYYNIPDSLKTITITDEDKIPFGAFFNCKYLQQVVLQKAVTQISEYAMYECSGLETLEIQNKDCEIADSSNTICESATIVGYSDSSAHIYATRYNRTFIALDEPIMHKVVFCNYDGTVLKTEFVEHGCSATAPADPERTGFTFSCWNLNLDNITCDLMIIAQFHINTYTVTYLDGVTGEVISTATAEHGADAVFPTAPEHDGYTFTGWDSDGKNITSDTVITALYEESTSVTLGDANGDGVINGKDVTLIRRYITGGYDVEVIFEAADINGDGVINGKDITLLRRLIVGGYGDVA